MGYRSNPPTDFDIIHPLFSLSHHDWRPPDRYRSKFIIDPRLLSILLVLLIIGPSILVPPSACSSNPVSTLKREISSDRTPSSFPSIPSSPPPAHHLTPALPDNSSDISPVDYACQPIGPCQPCPLDELSNPVCEIYHSRRLVDCIYLGNLSSSSNSLEPIRSSNLSSNSSLNNATIDPSSSHQNRIGAGLGAAEFQTWEACERVVLKERQDFYEFVLCNSFIAALSLIIYGLRTKQLVIRQYGNLAARIGILPS